jgi:hypothetical protein
MMTLKTVGTRAGPGLRDRDHPPGHPGSPLPRPRRPDPGRPLPRRPRAVTVTPVSPFLFPRRDASQAIVLSRARSRARQKLKL